MEVCERLGTRLSRRRIGHCSLTFMHMTHLLKRVYTCRGYCGLAFICKVGLNSKYRGIAITTRNN
jgi:hypothetical protein